MFFLYNNDAYYRSGTYTNDLYTPDLEVPRFNINYKNKKLDNQYPYYL
jgi:hypothetical protein